MQISVAEYEDLKQEINEALTAARMPCDNW